MQNDKKRGMWKLGKVESLIIGKDGKARAANVKTESKTLLKRPIQKLYPLEINAVEDSSHRVVVPEAKSDAPARDRPSEACSDEVFEAEASGSAPTAAAPEKTDSRGRKIRLPTRYRDDYVFD